MQTPTYSELFAPTIDALRYLGGSGSATEIEAELIRVLDLNVLNEQPSNLKLFRSHLSWARTYLKKYGLVINSKMGVWSLTAMGQTAIGVNPKDIDLFVRNGESRVATLSVDIKEARNGEQEILATLQKLTPSGFEYFCVRILRESGFERLEVTGRSGDGGIDGKGVVLIGGLLSYHVLFQAKKYRDNVGSGAVRDFRGALSGRADKGLIITTGGFTPSAIEEANRFGAAPIDLIDGTRLAGLMKEHQLGVLISTKEIITIDHQWFAQYLELK